MPDTERPRAARDDLVHDDHTRIPIIDVEDVGPRVWRVWVKSRITNPSVVCRLPALDREGRRAYTPDIDAVREAIS